MCSYSKEEIEELTFKIKYIFCILLLHTFYSNEDRRELQENSWVFKSGVENCWQVSWKHYMLLNSCCFSHLDSIDLVGIVAFFFLNGFSASRLQRRKNLNTWVGSDASLYLFTVNTPPFFFLKKFLKSKKPQGPWILGIDNHLDISVTLFLHS